MRASILAAAACIALAFGVLTGAQANRETSAAAQAGRLEVVVRGDVGRTRIDAVVRRVGRSAVERVQGRRTLALRLSAGEYVVSVLRRTCEDAACKRPARTLARCRRSVRISSGFVFRLTVRADGCRAARFRSDTTSNPPPATTSNPSTTPFTLPTGTGIGGIVQRRSGNCMPGTPGSPSTCGTANVSREVLVFAPPLPSGEFAGTSYSGGRSPSARTTSSGDGSYVVDLEPGSYSVLVVDDGERYCNLFSEFAACQVDVRVGERTRNDVVVDRGTQ